MGDIVTAGLSAIAHKVEGAKSEASKQVTLSMPVVAPLAPSMSVPSVSNQFGFATTTASTSVVAAFEPTTVIATATPRISSSTDKTWPYFGLIVIMTLGLIGTALKVTRNQNN